MVQDSFIDAKVHRLDSHRIPLSSVAQLYHFFVDITDIVDFEDCFAPRGDI